MTTRLGRTPAVIDHAKKLGLPVDGDCLEQIKDFANNKVKQILNTQDIQNLDQLKISLAEKLGLRLELLTSDQDMNFFKEEYEVFFDGLLERWLQKEFVRGSTEGLLLEPSNIDKCPFKFFAIIDARGKRGARAYFTSWHEIVHLLIEPDDEPFEAFRRTPSPFEIKKDPIEQIVDIIAGNLAFHPRFFEAPIMWGIQNYDHLTFSVIESARDKAAPSASLYAAALASLTYARRPTIFFTVELGFKKSEECYANQRTLGLNDKNTLPKEKLRVRNLTLSDRAKDTYSIYNNMRIPDSSIISRIFSSNIDLEDSALENQAMWETSREGQLEELPIFVNAIRRGQYVYVLMSV